MPTTVEPLFWTMPRAAWLRRLMWAETHLQHVATGAAVSLERLAAWFRAIPRTTTRTSRFAALAA